VVVSVVVVVVEAAVRCQFWLVVVVVAVRDSEASDGCSVGGGGGGSDSRVVQGVNDGGLVVGLVKMNSDSDGSNGGEDDQWFGYKVMIGTKVVLVMVGR
jgi:hypothetical protein